MDKKFVALLAETADQVIAMLESPIQGVPSAKIIHRENTRKILAAAFKGMERAVREKTMREKAVKP